MYTNAEYIQEGLQIEQASVLYNICKCCFWPKTINLYFNIAYLCDYVGCLHSILASRGRRDTEQVGVQILASLCFSVDVLRCVVVVVNSLGDERSYHSLSVCCWRLCLSRCKNTLPMNASDTNITMFHLLSTQERFATSHASKDLGPEFIAFYKNLMLVSFQSIM